MKDYIYIIFGILFFIGIIALENYNCNKRGMTYNFGESKSVLKKY